MSEEQPITKDELLKVIFGDYGVPDHCNFFCDQQMRLWNALYRHAYHKIVAYDDIKKQYEDLEKENSKMTKRIEKLEGLEDILRDIDHELNELRETVKGMIELEEELRKEKKRNVALMLENEALNRECDILDKQLVKVMKVLKSQELIDEMVKDTYRIGNKRYRHIT